MTNAVQLIVPDATPLVTLAAAGELDLLLRPGVPVIVPDGVKWETTRFPDKLGGQDIVDWLKVNADTVRIAPTREFENFSILIREGVKRVPNLGERCALEVVNDAIAGPDPKRSILIYEDSDVPGLIVLRPERVSSLTTAEFLDGLEAARLIQSADRILDAAVQAGRDKSARVRNQDQEAFRAFMNRGGFGR